jgi:hypothetical protein
MNWDLGSRGGFLSPPLQIQSSYGSWLYRALSLAGRVRIPGERYVIARE